MGYTHYWDQTRDYTDEEWNQIREDMTELLKDVQHVQGIPLGNWNGDPGSSPAITDKDIRFNGVGEDHYETFVVWRKPRRGEESIGCKTARKPYDLAVTAALCYLATVEPAVFRVTSDGHGREWLDGLAEARRALPRYANQLDIPMGILKADRWCPPWVSTYARSGFDVEFCVDGKGYVQNLKTCEWYCFGSHQALAQFLDRTKRATFRKSHRVHWRQWHEDVGNVEPNIWNATGMFDKERHARIARAQARALAPLFPPDAAHAHEPPAYVRPGEMPEPETRAYSFAELLNL